MKKNIFSLLLTLLTTQIFYPGSSISSLHTKKTQKEETPKKIEIENLILPLQNQIIEYAWQQHDNANNFENTLLKWENIDSIKQNDTSILDQWKYDFHGNKLPIYFYTLKNGLPTIIKVGNIIENAQPSIIKGLIYNDSQIPTTQLFLHEPNEKLLKITLQYFSTPQEITSACLSVLGKLAITWKNNLSETFVTTVDLNDIKNNEAIYLKQNAIEFDKIKHKAYQKIYGVVIKGSLFTLDGTKLGICSNDLIKNNIDYSVQCIDMNPPEPLTIDEKAKRLGIATVGAKKLLENRK